MRIAAFLTSAALICAATTVHAGEVSGTVYDASGRPAVGVELTIADLGVAAVTSADGSYRFADVADGQHRIALVQGSQAIQRVSVTVANNAATARNIVMISPAAMRDFQASSHPADLPAEPQTFAGARELADQMLREVPAQTAQDWRWRDLDG